jgi:hypothetical protein
LSKDWLDPIGTASQQDIADIKWKPNDAGTLAVAASTGVFLWKIFPRAVSSAFSKPSVLYSSQNWFCREFGRVSSVDWAPCGSLLFISFRFTSKIVVWDTLRDVCQPVNCMSLSDIIFHSRLLLTRPFLSSPAEDLQTGGTKKLSLSRNGLYIAQLLHSGDLFIVDVQTAKRIQYKRNTSSFCWIDSNVLLYAQNDAELHVVQISKVEAVMKVKEMRGQTRIETAGQAGTMQINELSSDPSGKRLAVSSLSGLHVYSISYTPLVRLQHMGRVKHKEERVAAFYWASNFDLGALLTTVYESGKIVFVPCLFRESLLNSRGLTM